MKKHTVETIELTENCEIPIIQCPAVHPLAYLDPNPTNNPPIKKKRILLLE